jgi:hypothetical protein
MSEGHVYVCGWRLTEAGYEGWIERWPKRRVTGATFSDMENALLDVVGEKVGDGEPQFEFEPPFLEPAGWEHFFRDGWRSTFFVDGLRPATPAGLFDGGFCDRCKYPIGKRTDARLTIEWGPWARGTKCFQATIYSAMRVPVASERLLDVFTPQERASFEARPVALTTASRSRFFEFVPRRFVPDVGGKPFRPDGWQCGRCGRRLVSNAKVLGYGPHVVCRADIEPGAGLFFRGDPGHFSLCYSAARWHAVKATLRAAGITSSPVAIIEPADVEKSPVLQDYPSS